MFEKHIDIAEFLELLQELLDSNNNAISGNPFKVKLMRVRIGTTPDLVTTQYQILENAVVKLEKQPNFAVIVITDDISMYSFSIVLNKVTVKSNKKRVEITHERGGTKQTISIGSHK